MIKKIIISSLTCKRCGYSWIPRKVEIPITCPSCRSPYWNKEKRIKFNDK